MAHVKICKGCGATFAAVNSLSESYCQKCQPGSGGCVGKTIDFLDKWAVEVIESWTPTAVELMTSPTFWRKRIDEQIEYIARNNGKVRPEVIDSALAILERCQSHYYGFSQAQRIEALANEIVESNNRDE